MFSVCVQRLCRPQILLSTLTGLAQAQERIPHERIQLQRFRIVFNRLVQILVGMP